MEQLLAIINDIKKRLELLEGVVSLTNITIPNDGKLVVDKKASDPTAEKGRIYFNTTLNKYRVSEDGITFKTITTT